MWIESEQKSLPKMIFDNENLYEEKPFEITGGSEILVTEMTYNFLTKIT